MLLERTFPQFLSWFGKLNNSTCALLLFLSFVAMALKEMTEHYNHSEKFREIFFPDGQPLLPGMFLRRPDLAALLDLIGSRGVSAFYSGNVTQEIISEVSHSLLCTYISVCLGICMSKEYSC